MAVTRTSAEAASSTTVTLSDDALVEIFRFAGPGNFRFFAGTNRQFFRACTLLRDGYDFDSKKRKSSDAATAEKKTKNEGNDGNFETNNTTGDDQQSSLQSSDLLSALNNTSSTATVRKKKENPWSFTTNMKHVVESVARCKFYYQDEIVRGKGNKIKQRKLDQLVRVAARYNHLESLQYVVQNLGGSMNQTLGSVFASSGALQCATWALQSYQIRFDCISFRFAAAGGHLEFLKWLRSIGCPSDRMACAYAAMNGHIETLKWLRMMNCPWHALTCAYIARNGDLPMLQWARENGCRWDKMTCAEAARNGHLEVLQWARRNRCPWDKLTCRWAFQNGHEEVLRWAIDNGCPRDF